MKNPDATYLIHYALIRMGFGGLYSDTCCCDLENLAPCGEIETRCLAGYKLFPPKDVDAGVKFAIYPDRDMKPWADFPRIRRIELEETEE